VQPTAGGTVFGRAVLMRITAIAGHNDGALSVLARELKIRHLVPYFGRKYRKVMD